MQFRFVYRTDDTSALSHSLDSAEISCSVHKCEWHSSLKLNKLHTYISSIHT